MKLGAALLGAVAFFALTTPAEAKRFTSWYFGVDGGASDVVDVDVATYTVPGPPPVEQAISLDYGLAAFVTAGYAFDNNWRFEIEGGYRYNAIDTITPSGGVAAPLDGDAKEYTLMANILYDFESSSDLLMSLGAGIGADYTRVDAAFAPPFDGEDISLAFQALAQFAYPVTNWMDLTLNYRYLYVTELGLSDDTNPLAIANVDTDPIQKHAVTLGLRFGGRSKKMMKPALAAGPPPPPPPAPTVARQYVIFFGFNKCNVTADADAVLSEAASAARTLGSTTIKIVGHTDTVGKASANQILSECRANAAKINLASKGIPAGSIIATGRGETQLLVQTPDNVKEPQNRRATVDL